MISRLVGTILKKNTRTKVWWMKLAVAIILSNVFFFALFSSPAMPVEITNRAGWVEAQFKGELMTPFHSGKKVVLLNRKRAIQMEGVLQGDINTEGKYTAWVKESEASTLFQFSEWEILPHLKGLKIAVIKKNRMNHEIRY
ncbi:MAG TPA: hypothetical protein VNJ08_07475 [Bacteriovoracaceae bacterium]|nr:hypothetical protein [Bacteriovoracaceae bacterium]